SDFIIILESRVCSSPSEADGEGGDERSRSRPATPLASCQAAAVVVVGFRIDTEPVRVREEITPGQTERGGAGSRNEGAGQLVGQRKGTQAEEVGRPGPEVVPSPFRVEGISAAGAPFGRDVVEGAGVTREPGLELPLDLEAGREGEAPGIDLP